MARTIAPVLPAETMERLRRVAAFWNWLPAFRAVAETEHLPTASEHLMVTAPALSRSIKLLENELGHKLFRRSGRRIELNEAGHRFLAAVRDAMRLVHEGVLELRSEQLVGTVKIASSGVNTSFLVPTLSRLRREHPELRPEVTTVRSREIVRDLLTGRIDLALLSVPIDHPGLDVEHLGQTTSGIYCGVQHPLYRAQQVRFEDILEHDFVAPVPLSDGKTHEGWPVDQQRRVAVHVDQMRVGADLCARGQLLAVLPDIVARDSGFELRRLPSARIEPINLFALRRPELGRPTRVDVIVNLIKDEISKLTAPE